jgi:hypothetical protein
MKFQGITLPRLLYADPGMSPHLKPLPAWMRPQPDPESEWVGGFIQSPSYVLEPRIYRPLIAVWVDARGIILAMEAVEPPETPEGLARVLRQAMASPATGSPRTPTKVRVWDREMARALLRVLPNGTDVIEGDTPELDNVEHALRSAHRRQPGPSSPESYMDINVPPEIVAGFFRACARLWRASPWTHALDSHLIEVSIPGTGVKEEVLSIIGNLGQEFGVIRFFSVVDYDLYRDVAGAHMERGEPVENQGCDIMATNFERRKNVPSSMLDEIARYGWELAEPGYCPLLLQSDDDLLVRPNTAEDYGQAAAMAEALAAFTEEHPGIFSERAPKPVRFLWTHRGSAGPIKVRLRAPYPDPIRGPLWADSA